MQLNLETNAFQTAVISAPATTRAFPFPELILGDPQDLTILDAKDRIVAYGHFHGSAASDLIRYDGNGAPVARAFSRGNGHTALVRPDGTTVGYAKAAADRAIEYFDAKGRLAGKARIANDTIVEYFDWMGRKVGAGIIERTRLVLIDSKGAYAGRKVSNQRPGNWLALHDAWELFLAGPLATSLL